MGTMCPVCNGLMEQGPLCSSCGAEMQDAGLVTDYLGPYSPYFHTSFESPCCLHLFTCPRCRKDKRIAVKLINI